MVNLFPKLGRLSVDHRMFQFRKSVTFTMINTGTMTSGDVGMLRKVTIVALHCCVSRIRRGSFKEKEFYKDSHDDL